ncbi:ACP S-malonyltransferase [Aliidiomarina maris]|uniref:Malonyl CoA-acyl carrier protein transacylase n=1 Tax=Aliidiomarina maris TaxID=531312 RepID=A0A327WZD3_9GAMM|nr:ACP S-malonyltransferase [Aliidiomarina maris]RAJ98869.1 [acyl-carrier-protein] S-malonyltransferase [Aliidiomarina maris]RUO25016.1 [acyl-carrier-protein] S-malonyltransferase [Aliidiomarina maris]
MASQFALVFPGQGSQVTGMLSDLADEYTAVKETFAQASEVLGYDLWDLVQSNPDDKLNQTEYTQPALLAASVAIYRCVAPHIGQPVLMAGHSLGEYSALVCSGALDFASAIKLVQLRGQAMQQAVPEGTGAMAAVIGLDDEAIAIACEQSAQGEVVAPVNYNSPGQVVIAGQKDAVARAGDACKAAGAKRVLPLPVSVPSHCELMRPAAEVLADALTQVSIQAPDMTVLHNVDVSEANASTIAANLVAQLHSPVLWTQTMQRMAADGITKVYEIGPGKVLTGLSKRIDKALDTQAVNDPESVQMIIKEQAK